MFIQSQLVWEYTHHTMLQMQPYTLRIMRWIDIHALYICTHVFEWNVFVTKVTIKSLKYN